MLLGRFVSLSILALVAAMVWGSPAFGQSDSPADPPPLLATAQPAVRPVAPAVPAPEDKRIFGVLPNNRTTEESIPFQRLTAKQKITIAFKDSFDWPVF